MARKKKEVVETESVAEAEPIPESELVTEPVAEEVPATPQEEVPLQIPNNPGWEVEPFNIPTTLIPDMPAGPKAGEEAQFVKERMEMYKEYYENPMPLPFEPPPKT
jgi:hypothetical protein